MELAKSMRLARALVMEDKVMGRESDRMREVPPDGKRTRQRKLYRVK